MKNTTLSLVGLWLVSMAAHAQSNLLSNSNFEEWGQVSLSVDSDSIPLDWSGSATNLFYPDVSRTSDSFSGLYACRLKHTQKAFARFSSSAVNLSGGPYTLQFFAKGEGIIRNGYYNGSSYANYSTPDTLSSDSWKKYQYHFTLKNAEPLPIQLIFSLSQTSPSGIIIDNVTLISHTITELPSREIPLYYIEGSTLHLNLPSITPVCLYNLFGSLVYATENTSFSISLTSGVYLLSISGRIYKIRID